MIGNVIVGQSGGPTAVINASLMGVYTTAKEAGASKIYGMRNGVEGLLEERYIEISDYIKDDLDAELLKRTPASFLGSCRYKLPDPEKKPEVFKKLFSVLEKLEIKHFFYIGGNDSMDTINKLAKYSEENNKNINFIGVPKTIDNDLAITDHTPGFGSAAKFIGTVFKEIIIDSYSYDLEQVIIVECMGRNAGWLTAASTLSIGEDCDGPDLIYLPEIPFDTLKFLEKVKEVMRKRKTVIVAVSEGLKTKSGGYVCDDTDDIDVVDSFGHKCLGGTATVLADLLTRRLGCKTRAVELSTLQRSASHCASKVDVREAFKAGAYAVKVSLAGVTGKVIVFKRVTDNPYCMIIETTDSEEIANIEKKVPLKWITEDGTYVSNELTNYIRPLIQGEVTPIMVNGLPRHIRIKKHVED